MDGQNEQDWAVIGSSLSVGYKPDTGSGSYVPSKHTFSQTHVKTYKKKGRRTKQKKHFVEKEHKICFRKQ